MKEPGDANPERPAGLITPEMHAAIGSRSEPWTCEVDRTGIRAFARAVGHTDAIYYNEAAARAAGYRSLPCPPGFLGTPIYRPGEGDPTARDLDLIPQPDPPLLRALGGGMEFEYDGPTVCAGDLLTAQAELLSLDERRTSLGPTLLATTRTILTDAAGVAVAARLRHVIRY